MQALGDMRDQAGGWLAGDTNPGLVALEARQLIGLRGGGVGEHHEVRSTVVRVQEETPFLHHGDHAFQDPHRLPPRCCCGEHGGRGEVPGVALS
jgi:hypothetical protein